MLLSAEIAIGRYPCMCMYANYASLMCSVDQEFRRHYSSNTDVSKVEFGLRTAMVRVGCWGDTLPIKYRLIRFNQVSLEKYVPPDPTRNPGKPQFSAG